MLKAREGPFLTYSATFLIRNKCVKIKPGAAFSIFRYFCNVNHVFKKSGKLLLVYELLISIITNSVKDAFLMIALLVDLANYIKLLQTVTVYFINY